MDETIMNQQHSYDVLVIGAGAAGVTAAMQAQAAGASVLVLEKSTYEERGGNSKVSGQIVFWPNNVEKAQQYFKAMAEPYTDFLTPEMIRVWAQEMHANRAWLEALGMDVHHVQSIEYPDLPGSDCVEVILHGSGPYGEARLWNQVIEPAFERCNIEVRYETPVERLIVEDGEVVGVIASVRGSEQMIYARRGVVLACGGFQNNQTMVRTYMSDLPNCYPLGSPHNTGDGIKMAMSAGAQLWHMNNMAGPNLAFKSPDYAVCARLGALKANSYLYVGCDGQRFVSEAPNFLVKDGKQYSPIKHGKIMRHGRFVQYPCPVPMYLIFDEQVRRAGGLCGRAAGFAFGWEVIQPNGYLWSSDNQREIDLGWIRRGDSIEELAAHLDLPEGSLTQSVNRFNTMCETGLDSDFSRASNQMNALHTGPYYALPLVPSMLNTQGGPVRNERAQVMHVDGSPIARLYSAGELGSIYAYKYQAGGNLGECFATGRIAGQNAASEPLR